MTKQSWILEYRTFFKRVSQKPISAHSQALWHYLMFKANEAWWEFPLTINLIELSFMLQISLSSVKRARKELAENGYIICESQTGNLPAQYYIMSNVNPGELINLKRKTASFNK